MKHILRLPIVVFIITLLASCATEPRAAHNNKAIRIALIKYEMARNIIIHKDYKNLASAFTYLNYARKILKNDARVYYLLAIAYQMRGNLNKYEEYLKRTIQLNKNFFDAYNGLGIYYFETKRYKKSLNIFTKLINNPLYPYAGVAFFNRSRVYLALNNIKAAEDDLKSAVVFSNYSNTIYWKALIDLQLRHKQYLKALENLVSMENHIGSSCYTITTKAKCFIGLRDYPRALSELNKIKDVSSNCFSIKKKLLKEIPNDNNTND